MPTRITLIYHAYKNFEVPNKIAKMIQDGTISWRSAHDDLFYTDENGKEQCVSSISECVAWEGHDDYEVAESEEESEEEDEDEEDDCVIPPCCRGVEGCSQCVDEEDEEGEEGEPLVEGVDYEQINSGVVWRESACEGPCHADGRCCYRSYKMAEKIEAHYKKSSAK
jgi:hypothetical protein